MENQTENEKDKHEEVPNGTEPVLMFSDLIKNADLQTVRSIGQSNSSAAKDFLDRCCLQIGIGNLHDNQVELGGNKDGLNTHVLRDGKPITVDLSLLRTGVPDSGEDECGNHKWPALLKFEGNGARLDFIASEHFGDSLQRSKELIRDQMANDPPEYVVVEGFSGTQLPQGMISPEELKKYPEGALKGVPPEKWPVWAKNPPAGWPESKYAALLARSLRIPVIGGETPVGFEQLINMKDDSGKEKFTAQDLMFSGFMADMLIDAHEELDRRKGKANEGAPLLPPDPFAKDEEGMKQYFNQRIKGRQDQLIERLGKDNAPDFEKMGLSYENFKNWVKNNSELKENFNPLEVNKALLNKYDETLYPIDKDAADEINGDRANNDKLNADTKLHQINHAGLYLRNEHLTKLLAEKLNEHKHVLVVYGASHYVDQRAVLENMFVQRRRAS